MTSPDVRTWVCIDDPPQRLYAELIQVVEVRGIAWLRPVALMDLDAPEPCLESCVDLRQGPDLLLPLRFIRPALDTEVLSLLSQLLVDSAPADDKPLLPHHRQQLNHWLQQLCQDHPQDFGSPPG
jgi:hypothetical protein